MEYYVYTYLDSSEIINKEYCDIYFEYRPVYIGKGKNLRMFNHLTDRKRHKTMFYNKLNKMIREDNVPLIVKLKEFSNEKDALEFEILLIDNIKSIKSGGLLYNTTTGGAGVPGYFFTDEVRSKMSKRSIEENHYLRFPITKGENHPMFGKKHKQSSIDKMSNSKKGKIQSKETIEKRIAKLRGVPLSQEHKDKLSDSNKGKVVSEETRKKQSLSRLGKEPHNKGKIKDVILQIDIDGNIVKEWYNLTELKISGYEKSNIINVCMGKRKSHAGFIWKYKSDYIN